MDFQTSAHSFVYDFLIFEVSKNILVIGQRAAGHELTKATWEQQRERKALSSGKSQCFGSSQMTGILSSINEIGSGKYALCELICLEHVFCRRMNGREIFLADLRYFSLLLIESKISLSPFTAERITRHMKAPKTIIFFIKSNGVHCSHIVCERTIGNANEPGSNEPFHRHFSIFSSPPQELTLHHFILLHYSCQRASTAAK